MEISDYSFVPPGFRFHPTEEELVGYYLKRKINSLKTSLDVIVDIDLYKMEPWDVQERCKLGYEEQSEWYFFSYKDRKYPTGTRTNRATAAGFWKATGRDKAVLSKNKVIGMRKTLVFYQGRAPNGHKTDWIMHEYRLQTSDHGPPQEEGWVVCRAFKKPIPNQQPAFEAWNLHAYHIKGDNTSHFCRLPQNNNITAGMGTGTPSSSSSSHHHFHDPNDHHIFYQPNVVDPEQQYHHHPLIAAISSTNINCLLENSQLMELPQLDSPTTELLTSATEGCDNEEKSHDSSTIDWRNLDTLLATKTTSYDAQFLGRSPAGS